MEEARVENGEQPAPPAEIKTSRRYMIVAAALLLVIIAGAALMRREDGRGSDSRADPAAATPSGDIIEATPEQLQQIRIEEVREQVMDVDLETTGKVGFNEDRMTPVIAPYAGRVLEVLANKGDVVKANQPLIVLESSDLVTAINDLAEARAEFEKTIIALDTADKAAQRARNLNALEALAAKDLQAAESDLARTREEQRRARGALAAARNRLALFGKSTDEIAQLEESLADRIDRRIVIRAPLAGTIVERKVGPGQYIKPDAPDPLYLISDLSTLWVNADVYETHLPLIHLGAPVEITTAAYPDRKFPAQISFINPTVDAATRTIHVRCLVTNTGGLLKPEMFANIRIRQTSKRRAPSVPSTAILTEGSDAYVLLESSPAHFRRRLVKRGVEIEGYTVVEQGLAAGDRVVTAGVLLLNGAFSGK